MYKAGIHKSRYAKMGVKRRSPLSPCFVTGKPTGWCTSSLAYASWCSTCAANGHKPSALSLSPGASTTGA